NCAGGWEDYMAEKLDPHQAVTIEELVLSLMYEQEATRRLLVRKGVLTQEEVLEEVKAVRRVMEGRRGRYSTERGNWVLRHSAG
ncbi:MAG: hypothetical protein ACE5JQ_15265, partial [Candidatus Methylomirabilales bacterium]